MVSRRQIMAQMVRHCSRDNSIVEPLPIISKFLRGRRPFSLLVPLGFVWPYTYRTSTSLKFTKFGIYDVLAYKFSEKNFVCDTISWELVMILFKCKRRKMSARKISVIWECLRLDILRYSTLNSLQFIPCWGFNHQRRRRGWRSGTAANLED